MRKSIFLGALLCLIASMSWGAMFPVAHHAFQYIDPFYFTIVRYIPVVIILVILLYFIEGKKAFSLDGHGLLLWFFGMMGFTVYNLLIFVGQDLLGDPGVLLASVMEALAPTISVLVIWAVFKSRPKFFTLLCIIGAFIGVLFVVTDGDLSIFFGENRGMPLFILFLAATGWAVYTMGGASFPNWSALRYSTLSCLYGTATATVVVIIGSFTGHIEVPTLTELYAVRYNMIFMSLLPGLFALLGWNKGVSILKPINGILFINFAPVTTIVIRVIQGHTITSFEIFGVTLVSVMLIANNMYQRMNMRRTDLRAIERDA